MKREKSLETMLTLVVGTIVLYLIFNIKLMLIIGLLLGGIGLFLSGWSDHISRLWYKLAEGLGFVVSKVLLTLVFFAFLLPIALLSRLFRGTPLVLQRKKEGSYYQVRNHHYLAKDIKNPW